MTSRITLLKCTRMLGLKLINVYFTWSMHVADNNGKLEKVFGEGVLDIRKSIDDTHMVVCCDFRDEFLVQYKATFIVNRATDIPRQTLYHIALNFNPTNNAVEIKDMYNVTEQMKELISRNDWSK